jgi:hypothetical protein
MIFYPGHNFTLTIIILYWIGYMGLRPIYLSNRMFISGRFVFWSIVLAPIGSLFLIQTKNSESKVWIRKYLANQVKSKIDHKRLEMNRMQLKKKKTKKR